MNHLKLRANAAKKTIHLLVREKARRLRQIHNESLTTSNGWEGYVTVSPEESTLAKMHAYKHFQLRQVEEWLSSAGMDASSASNFAGKLLARLKKTSQVYFDKPTARWVMP